jgi:hypothetical protein
MVRRQDGRYSRMPLDADPAPDGNLAVYRDHLGALKARTLKKGEEPDLYERRGKSHFATCKHADRFRKRADGLPKNVIPLRRKA